jgi:hypothetical protein
MQASGRARRIGAAHSGRSARYSFAVDRRYQVFVSSTFLDLKEERAAVVSALLQMDAIPAGMELFPAADDDAWTLIERVIEASDYYLLVIGGKYGSIDPASELSYTEKEFDFAVAKGKPVMAFLHENPDEIPLGKSEQDDAARAKLAQFREKVQSSKHVKYWSSPEVLAGMVALTFGSFRQTYPAVGWIRGDAQASTEALTELNELRKQLAAAEQRLESTRHGPPPGTERLAQGADRVSVAVRAQVRVRTDKAPAPRFVRRDMVVEPPWDDLFSAVGPSLLDEASQETVNAGMNAWLTAKFGNRVRRDVRAQLAEDDERVTRFSGTQVALTEDAFGTLLVQLRALGLIQRSERKRSVSDKATYWTLTPYGDTHLTTLRAISRDPPRAPRDEEEEKEEEE